jgi:alkylhydroperoxidase family enzyme
MPGVLVERVEGMRWDSRLKRGNHMASIKLIPEEEATGRAAEIYREIKQSLGIDFVPNMYKAMAANPAFLEANWNKIQAIMKGSGKLDPLQKEIIAVAVSAVNGCEY